MVGIRRIPRAHQVSRGDIIIQIVLLAEFLDELLLDLALLFNLLVLEGSSLFDDAGQLGHVRAQVSLLRQHLLEH